MAVLSKLKFEFYLGQPNHHLMKEVKANFIATGTTVEKFPLVIETDYNIPVLEKNIIFIWSYILPLLIYILNLKKQFWMQRGPEWWSLGKFMKQMKQTFLLLIDSKVILTFIHVRISRRDSKQKKINHINILRPPVLIRYKIVNFSQSIRTLRFRRSFTNILKAFRIKGPGQFLFKI